jgi:hypothetical protein
MMLLTGRRLGSGIAYEEAGPERRSSVVWLDLEIIASWSIRGKTVR